MPGLALRVVPPVLKRRILIPLLPQHVGAAPSAGRAAKIPHPGSPCVARFACLAGTPMPIEQKKWAGMLSPPTRRALKHNQVDLSARKTRSIDVN
jgi:hypothetical protein